ncbi:unnamed protein product, partial [Rotaria magnacalcarata]
MTRDEREALSQRICNFYIDSSNSSVKTKSGRPYKISDEQLDGLVKSVNNRCGLSQRKLGRRFGDNPPNVPQARSIETVWALLERKVYENNWEAKYLDALARRIKQKAKEFDQNMLQTMIEGVRKKLWAMWRDGLYS